MIYINHRINTVDALGKVPLKHGIELDVRYHENDLILHHDPFHHHEEPKPILFETLLDRWQHEGPMILNIKTEGIEIQCIQLMKSYNIKDWFFLDLSMPYFVTYADKAKDQFIDGFGVDNLAVRFSEREPLAYALSFSGKARWVWVDCFTHMPLTDTRYKQLTQAGFKICLVSPELQGHSLDQIRTFKQNLKGMEIDAVCTKRPDLWEE